jgi:hypothetical protein
MSPDAVRQRRHRKRERDKAGVLEWSRQERLRHVYDLTEPRVDLCEFDARGMDVIEGRT